MRIISSLLLLFTFSTSQAYAQWGQPSPQYQQVCGIPNAPPCPGQYPQYHQPPPQAYGYPVQPYIPPAPPQQNYGNQFQSNQIDGACLGRCIGQGGTGPQCQRACGN